MRQRHSTASTWPPQAFFKITPDIGSDGTLYIGSAGIYALNPYGSQKWVFKKKSHRTILWMLLGRSFSLPQKKRILVRIVFLLEHRVPWL
jgi:hypothetical protein